MRRGWIPAVFVVSALGVGGGVARADVEVLTATVYPGNSGAVSNPTATQGSLAAHCAPYSGPNPLSLFGPHGSYKGQAQLSANYSWDLGTAISCGLGQSLSTITSVVVDNPQSGYESPLAPKQLTETSGYQDPAGPGALPVVSNDGGENLNTYVLPWRGGQDDNVQDWIPSRPGPIGLVIYENGASPLEVYASAEPGMPTATGQRYSLSARVRSASGQPIPSSSLSWRWTFDDGTKPSSEASPSHAFADGRYFVTVQVTDAGSGTGGTQTLALTVGDGQSATGQPQEGAGSTGPQAGPSTGQQSPPRQGGTTAAGTMPGLPRPSSSGSSGNPPANSGPRRSPPGQLAPPGNGGSSPSAPSAPASAGRQPAHHNSGRPTARARHHTSGSGAEPAPAAGPLPPPPGVPTPHTFHIPLGPVVAGQLISFTRPIQPQELPSLAATPATAPSAAPVRQNVVQSPVVGVVAAALALLVLTLGAARELRLRPRREAIVLQPVS